MLRFQQLNHDLLYRARAKLEEEKHTSVAVKTDSEVRAKIKELTRDGEVVRGESTRVREEIEDARRELREIVGRREDLEAELKKFEESTRSLYLANQVLRENLIKLMET